MNNDNKYDWNDSTPNSTSPKLAEKLSCKNTHKEYDGFKFPHSQEMMKVIKKC